MNDYQISNDGTIFNIKEDGSISKLGKIENGRIVSISNHTASSNSDSGKGALMFFLVVFIIATAVLGVLLGQSKRNYEYAVFNISTLETKINSLEGDLITARSEKDVAKRELSDFKDNVGRTIPFVISDIEIANTSYDGTIETGFGATIYSSRSMYLTPRIKYVGFTSGSKTIYVKIYNASGSLSTGRSSPSGYSYSTSFYFSTGQNTFQLSGWGSSTRGHWSSGSYRIEIWYNNSCMKSKTFTIY